MTIGLRLRISQAEENQLIEAKYFISEPVDLRAGDSFSLLYNLNSSSDDPDVGSRMGIITVKMKSKEKEIPEHQYPSTPIQLYHALLAEKLPAAQRRIDGVFLDATNAYIREEYQFFKATHHPRDRTLSYVLKRLNESDYPLHIGGKNQQMHKIYRELMLLMIPPEGKKGTWKA